MSYKILYNTDTGIKEKKVYLKDYAKIRFAGDFVGKNYPILGSLLDERDFIRRYYHINQKRTARHTLYLSPYMNQQDFQGLKEKMGNIQKKYSNILKINVKYPFESINRINIPYSLLFLFMKIQCQILISFINIFFMISIMSAYYFINERAFSSLFLNFVFLLMVVNALFMLILSSKKISEFLNIRCSRINLYQFIGIVLTVPVLLFFTPHTFSPGLLLIMSLIIFDLLIVSGFLVILYRKTFWRKQLNIS